MKLKLEASISAESYIIKVQVEMKGDDRQGGTGSYSMGLEERRSYIQWDRGAFTKLVRTGKGNIGAWLKVVNRPRSSHAGGVGGLKGQETTSYSTVLLWIILGCWESLGRGREKEEENLGRH